MITSYPIPPQESFTCPPYSIRVRRSDRTDVTRYTFIATRDGASHKITLFKDIVHSDGKTDSSTTQQILKTSSPQYITTATTTTEESSSIGEVLVVCDGGEVIGLSGETLAVQWSAGAKSTVEDVSPAAVEDFAVELATSATLTELKEGIFGSRSDVFSALPRATQSGSTFLVLVSRSSSKGQDTRHLLVLGIAPGLDSTTSDQQRLVPLDVTPIAHSATGGDVSPQYQLDVHSSLLLQLHEGALTVYDLSGAVPKVKSIMGLEGSSSFVRLSRPFVLSTSTDAIGLYNYQYRSVHGNTPLDLSDLPAESQSSRSCQLLTYVRSQELVVALIDNVLVSIQVEPPKSQGKRRKAGLLIDSIGRGTDGEVSLKRSKLAKAAGAFSKTLPGTMTEAYLTRYHTDIEKADGLLSTNEIGHWEEMLRKKFEIKIHSRSSVDETTQPSDLSKGQQNGDEADGLPEWEWLHDPSGYPSVDRRWVIYAINRVFSAEMSEGEEPRLTLRLVLPDSNVTTYLAVAGHLTLSNVKSAFREELEGDLASGKHFANDLVVCLTDADVSMTLLFNYLRSTKLGAVEVLCVIRALMISMDLIPDMTGATTRKLLKNVAHQEGEKDEMDLDDLEREIAMTETYLGDESSIRSRGLTAAFAKLWRLPSRTTVQALRTDLRMEEILSLIHLLRIELVQGAWTSLYIDPTSFDSEGNEPPPDGVIALIADLLGRCLDAVGAGGWLVNDAMLGTDSPEDGDFLVGLRLEVAAALEGIEEAVYLNGIVSESVRYSVAAQKSGAARQALSTNRPIPVHLESRESRMLPLGLKTKAVPSKDKVVSGGEVVQRSLRETGHLISQKVEAYSLEKLAV